MKISGRIAKVVYSKEKFHIFRATLDPVCDEAIRELGGNVVGVQCFGNVAEGMEFFASGEILETQHGKQLKAKEFVSGTTPPSRDAVVAYLQRSIDGVGPAKADQIYAAFGPDTFKVIAFAPAKLKSLGFGDAAIEKITTSFDKTGLQRNLTTLLGGANLGEKTLERATRHFGGADKAYDALSNNPYKLVELDRIGFKRADEIARAAGVPLTHPERIKSALTSQMKVIRDEGHTAPTREDVLRAVSGITDVSAEHITPVMEALIKDNVLATRYISGRVRISLLKDLQDEETIARELKRIMDNAPAFEVNDQVKALAATLKDEYQEAAVYGAVSNGVIVVTGGPGCGKTTTAKTILKALESFGISRSKMGLHSPTGKAAKRLSESVGSAASTMDSAIGSKVGGGRPKMGKDNPMPGDLFLIDEGSMVDNSLAARYLSAIPSGARLIMMGDDDQLRSVGAGRFLGDVIQSGQVPVVKLQNIHRTAADSDIAINARHLIRGNVRELNLTTGKDFKFSPIDLESSVKPDEQIFHMIIEKYLAYTRQYGNDAVAVITARHKTGCGTILLNEAIRNKVNPTGELCFGYRAGDRVINTKNRVINEVSIANGEVGKVVSVNSTGEPDTSTISVAFDDGIVILDRKAAIFMNLAYATSVHASQGSEYPVVLIAVAPSHIHMLNQNLVYTAATRGKQLVDMVGSVKHLKIAMGKPGAICDTGLVHAINSAAGKPTNTQGAEPQRSHALPAQTPQRERSSSPAERANTHTQGSGSLPRRTSIISKARGLAGAPAPVPNAPSPSGASSEPVETKTPAPAPTPSNSNSESSSAGNAPKFPPIRRRFSP